MITLAVVVKPLNLNIALSFAGFGYTIADIPFSMSAKPEAARVVKFITSPSTVSLAVVAKALYS